MLVADQKILSPSCIDCKSSDAPNWCHFCVKFTRVGSGMKWSLLFINSDFCSGRMLLPCFCGARLDSLDGRILIFLANGNIQGLTIHFFCCCCWRCKYNRLMWAAIQSEPINFKFHLRIFPMTFAWSTQHSEQAMTLWRAWCCVIKTCCSLKDATITW